MKRHEKKAPPAPPTPDDLWQAQTNEKCARAIAHWLKHSVNTSRPINTLKLPELEAMAQNAVSTFILEWHSRSRAAPTEEERRRVLAVFS